MVQVEFAPEAIDAGEQVNVETPDIKLIVPPLPAALENFPSGKEAITFPTGNNTVLPLSEFSVTATTATTPLPIGVAFLPLATQVTEPLAERQVRVFPAAVSAGPADGAIDRTSLLA